MGHIQRGSGAPSQLTVSRLEKVYALRIYGGKFESRGFKGSSRHLSILKSLALNCCFASRRF